MMDLLPKDKEGISDKKSHLNEKAPSLSSLYSVAQLCNFYFLCFMIIMEHALIQGRNKLCPERNMKKMFFFNIYKLILTNPD